MIIKDQIFKQLEKHGELSVKELTSILAVSKQAIHKALNQLQENQKVLKFGKSPKTFYRLNQKISTDKKESLVLTASESQFLKNDFLLITEIGEMLEGLKAFSLWCDKRGLPLRKTLDEYLLTKQKYLNYFDTNELINGTKKLYTTKGYGGFFVDELYYVDFYAIERFGKTRLGTLLHYAKQGQNKFLMQILFSEIKTKITRFITKNKIDAVAYVPPTIRREVQIMKMLEAYLNLNIPLVHLDKISGIIPVPQKSLSKLDERIKNAENTFAVSDQRKFKKLLLIDDAVGSGSTLNQIAKKIKNKSIAKKVIGLAIVGSFKGFDVITDI